MKPKIPSICFFAFVACVTAPGIITPASGQQPILIDFGNSSSYRGASQSGADSNGLYWTSVNSGTYYSNLVNTSNSATSLGFGFSASTGLGTDSYNGPSGATSNPITQTQIDAANINASALGILGGSNAAAVDFYVATDGRFVVQNLNPNETYNLTFFGSHKYNAVNTTDYAVYSNNTYGTQVGSTSLTVGVGANNNTSNTATIAGLAPQTNNTLYVRFGASGYTANGYINAMSIVGYVPYTTGGTTTLAAAKSYTGNTILGGGSTVNANIAGALGGGTSVLQLDSGGGNLALGSSQTVSSLIGAGNLSLTTGGNTLTLNPGGSTSFSVLTGSNGNFASNDYTGILSGSGTINKSGSGNQTLSGANTFNGTFKISDGTLTLNNVNALQNAKLDTTYGGSGTVAFAVAGSNTYNIGGLLGNRTVDMGANSLNISTANGSSFYDGVLSGSGSLTKSGAGTFTMRGNNTFTGSVTVSAGTLQISDDGPANGGSIASSSGITNNGSLVYNLNSNDRTYANQISGSGSLTKVGSNTLTLSGTNTYTGATNINAGKLVVNGNISTSSLTTVDVGATLGGSGTVGKTVVNGTLAVGNSPGTMSFTGTVDLNGITVMEIDGMSGAGVTGGHDFINLTGAGAAGMLTYGGAFVLDIGAIFTTGDYSWNLFDMASETGTFATISLADQYSGNLLDGDGNGIWDLTSGTNTWQFNESNGNLSLTVVPEPNVAALVGGLGIIALLRRRRNA